MKAVTRSEGGALSPSLRSLLNFVAAANLVIGALFFFNPELRINLWPSAIPELLARFIGAIVAGNAVGAWLVVRRGTWEAAWPLFAVALVYGALSLAALLYHLLFAGASPVFWAYAVVTAVFLVVILMIVRANSTE